MILIVEDEPYIAQFTAEICGELGLDTDICDEGDRAITKAGGNLYQLIVLDLRINGTQGLDVIKSIRELPEPFNRAKILIATAEAPRAIRKALAAGGNGFIEKPYSMEMLRTRISEMIAV